jgi:hypothetical protein
MATTFAPAPTTSPADPHRPGPVARLLGSLGLILMAAVMSMTLVVSVAPLGDAVAGTLLCRGGALETSTGPTESVAVRAGSGTQKGAASAHGTCTRSDGSVAAVSGDALALATIGGGAAIGAGLAAAGLATRSVRRRLSR